MSKDGSTAFQSHYVELLLSTTDLFLDLFYGESKQLIAHTNYKKKTTTDLFLCLFSGDFATFMVSSLPTGLRSSN